MACDWFNHSSALFFMETIPLTKPSTYPMFKSHERIA